MIDNMKIEIIEKSFPMISKQPIIHYYISFSNSYNKCQNKLISNKSPVIINNNLTNVIMSKSPQNIRRIQPLIHQRMQMIFTPK